MLYFDIETGLRTRVNFVHMTPNGQELVHTYFEDFRLLRGAGIKYPFRTTQRTPTYTTILRVNEVQPNVPIKESLFTMPSH